MADNNTSSPALELVVGVAGGEKITDGSGKRIFDTLKKIMKNINDDKNAPAFTIKKVEFDGKSGAENLRKSIQNVLDSQEFTIKKLKVEGSVDPNTGNNTGGSGSGKNRKNGGGGNNRKYTPRPAKTDAIFDATQKTAIATADKHLKIIEALQKKYGSLSKELIDAKNEFERLKNTIGGISGNTGKNYKALKDNTALIKEEGKAAREYISTFKELEKAKNSSGSPTKKPKKYPEVYDRDSVQLQVAQVEKSLSDIKKVEDAAAEVGGKLPSKLDEIKKKLQSTLASLNNVMNPPQGSTADDELSKIRSEVEKLPTNLRAAGKYVSKFKTDLKDLVTPKSVEDLLKDAENAAERYKALENSLSKFDTGDPNADKKEDRGNGFDMESHFGKDNEKAKKYLSEYEVYSESLRSALKDYNDEINSGNSNVERQKKLWDEVIQRYKNLLALEKDFSGDVDLAVKDRDEKRKASFDKSKRETRFKGLQKDYGKIVSTVSALYKERNQAEFDFIQGLIDELKSKSYEDVDLDRLENEIKSLDAKAALSGAKGGNMANYLIEKARSFITYEISSRVVMELARAFSSVLSIVKELDAAMVDLRIVTGKSADEAKEMVQEYAALATEVGASVTDTIAAAVEWQRQGYSDDETNELIKDSMYLSVVGMVESEDAAKALTAAMKAYNVEVSDAIRIVDRWTAVDMVAAVSAGELGVAMAETAVGARTAGVEMDNLVGYIAQVLETTQDAPESVGTFFRTLFARMSSVKAGDMTSDEGDDLSQVEATLRNVGIALRDQNGEFRDFDVVLQEVASSWDSYTNVQQRAIAGAFAGTRQQEKFLVLMEGFDNALEYTGIAAESAGTTLEKFSVVEEGIEYKTTKLKNTWSDFSMSLLNNDLIAFFLDLAGGLLAFINEAPTAVIQTTELTLAFTALYVILKSIGNTTWWDTLKTGFKGLFTSVSGWTGIIITALPLIASIVKYVYDASTGVLALENAAKEYEEAISSAASADADLESTASKLESIDSQIAQINERIQKGEKLSVVDEAQLDNLKEEKEELENVLAYQERISQIRKENAAVAAVGFARERYGQSEPEDYVTSRTGIASAFDDAYEARTSSGFGPENMQTDEFGPGDVAVDLITGAVADLVNGYDEESYDGIIATIVANRLALEKIKKDLEDYAGSEEAEDKLQALEENLAEAEKRAIDNIALIDEQLAAIEAAGLSDKYSETVAKLKAERLGYLEAVLPDQAFIEKLESTPIWDEAFEKIKKKFEVNGEVSAEDFAEAFGGEIPDELKKYLTGTLGYDLNSSGYILDLNEYLRDLVGVTSATEVALKSLDSLRESLTSLGSAYKTMAEASEEYNNTGSLSVDTFTSLMDLSPQYLGLLKDENDQINFNTEALIRNSAQMIEQIAVQKVRSLLASVLSAKTQGENAQLEILGKTAENTTEDLWGLVYAEISAANLSPKVAAALEEQIDVIRDMAGAAIEGLGSGGLSGSIESTKDSLKELNEASRLDQLEHSIESADILLQQFRNTLDSLSGVSDLTFDADYGTRMEIVSDQLETATLYGIELRNEFERLAATTPTTAAEAQALASRLETLGSDIRSNAEDVIKYRQELQMLRLESISAGADNAVAALEREQKLIDNSLALLEQGSLFSDVDFLLPSLPKDSISRQRAENKKLQAEENRHQEEILKIKQAALDKELDENEREREKQRQSLRLMLTEDAEFAKGLAEDVVKHAEEVSKEANLELRFSAKVDTSGIPFLNGAPKIKTSGAKVAPEGNSFEVEIDPPKLSGKWADLPVEIRGALVAKGYTNSLWNQFVEENPLEAPKILKEAWDNVRGRIVGKSGWAEGFLEALNSLVIDSELGAPSIDVDVWGKSAEKAVDTWFDAFNTAYNAHMGTFGGPSETMGGAMTTGVLDSSSKPVNSNSKISPGIGMFPTISGFQGPNVHKTGKAADYPAPAGTPIPALQSGTVVKHGAITDNRGRYISYGNRVVIQDDSGREYVYAHMSRFAGLSVGDRVRKGQVIGYVGTTGKSSGNHLHYGYNHYRDGGVTLPNENTLVGEAGRELGILPNGRVIMLGRRGAELVDLPPSTRILNHKDTEDVIKNTGEGIVGSRVPKFETGNAEVDKYLQIPYTYSDSFITAFNDWQKERQETLKTIKEMEKVDKEAAAEMMKALNDADQEKLQEMQIDLYENTADSLKESYSNLLAEYAAIKDTADPEVLQAYLEGLSQLQDEMYSVDEQWRDAIMAGYELAISKAKSFIDLLGHQWTEAVRDRDYYSMAQVVNKQIAHEQKIYQEAAKKKQELIDAGYDEESEAVLELENAMWESRDAIIGFREELANAVLEIYDTAIEANDSFDRWTPEYNKIDVLLEKQAKIDEAYRMGDLTTQKYNELTLANQVELYNERKAAQQEILDLTMEMIQQEIREKVEVLEQEKADYAEIVELKKKSLSLVREELSYEKTRADKVEEIADLQKEIDALANDTSRSGQAKRNQLLEEQAKLQEELAETQADHAFEVQTEALDKMNEDYAAGKDEEIRILEESIDTTVELYNLAIKRIDAGWDQLYKDLAQYVLDHGSGPQGIESLAVSWDIARESAMKYGSFVSSMDGISFEGHQTSTSGKDSGVQSYETAKVNSIVDKMKSNAKAWHSTEDDATKAKLAKENEELAAEIQSITGKTVTKSGGTWYIDGKYLFSNYGSDVSSQWLSTGQQQGSSSGTTQSSLTGKQYEEVKAIVGKMKANSVNWHRADEENRARLSSENEEYALQVEKILGTPLEKRNGEWYCKGKPLYEMFHSGGFVSGLATLKENEQFALLKKGELVFNDGQKEKLYEIIEFAKEIKEFARNTIKSFGSQPPVLAGVGPQSGAVFNMNLTINGDADESTVQSFRQAGRDLANDIFKTLGIRK